MRVLVSGATGFIGNHVVRELVSKNISTTCIIRKRKEHLTWFNKVDIVHHDIYKQKPDLKKFGNPDILIHLAWSGLPNYESDHHVKQNLPGDKLFLKSLISQGLKNLIVTGTCFEFGKKYGPLSPTTPTLPENPYAVAKDELRKWLTDLSKAKSFNFKWVRLFYMYGEGQAGNSVISQLIKAINDKDEYFKMSMGEQLRDYMDVKDVAKFLISLINDKSPSGVIHCCSESPISIRRLVEEHIKKNGANIKLDLGYYPYSKHESLAFWGSKK